MYVIVQVAGSQYRVKEGDMIDTNRLEHKEGESITLDQVLFFANDKDIQVGQPYLKNVKITAKVLKHGRAPKVIAFKFRRRKNYARTVGHRQDLTTLNITKIATS